MQLIACTLPLLALQSRFLCLLQSGRVDFCWALILFEIAIFIFLTPFPCSVCLLCRLFWKAGGGSHCLVHPWAFFLDSSFQVPRFGSLFGHAHTRTMRPIRS